MQRMSYTHVLYTLARPCPYYTLRLYRFKTIPPNPHGYRIQIRDIRERNKKKEVKDKKNNNEERRFFVRWALVEIFTKETLEEFIYFETVMMVMPSYDEIVETLCNIRDKMKMAFFEARLSARIFF